ncbi:MAG: (2Fe-2S) ferredoxin domain-containing protein [Lachnospiraceae bacterium]
MTRMKVEICIGSSCHLRGSKEVVTNMQALVKEFKMEKEIELCGSFCMGACSKGESVRVNEENIYHVRPEDVRDFFKEEILGRLPK